MTWPCLRAIGVSLLLVAGREQLHAQRGIEGGVQAQASFADFTFAGTGLHLGLRGGRSRFTVALTPGALDERFAVRGEATGQFLLNPSSRIKGLYAGAGIAGLTGPIDQGYLLVVVGLETRPGGSSGWVIEGGIGGGVRVLVGYRWRRLKR